MKSGTALAAVGDRVAAERGNRQASELGGHLRLGQGQPDGAAVRQTLGRVRMSGTTPY